MKRIPSFTLVFSFSLLAIPLPSARRQSQGDQTKAEAIRLNSYDVVQLELKAPVRLRDTEGKEHSYDRAYLFTLKGTFPRDQAMALELYIGDYQIPEYGGTRDGLYFRIYDPKLLERFDGKEFRYRFGSPEIHSFGQRFSLKFLRPLKTQKEQ
jgi:hypothetical protein